MGACFVSLVKEMGFGGQKMGKRREYAYYYHFPWNIQWRQGTGGVLGPRAEVSVHQPRGHCGGGRTLRRLRDSACHGAQ